MGVASDAREKPMNCGTAGRNPIRPLVFFGGEFKLVREGVL